MSTIGSGTAVAAGAGPLLTAAQAGRIAAVYLEARNTPNLGLLDAIYDPAVIVHDCSQPEPIRGLSALKTYYQGSHQGLPDFRMELPETLLAGDRLVFRWTVSGTHTGSLHGLPPTGRALRFSGVAIDRVVDGRIVEEWVEYNLLVILQQMGLAPSPLPPPEAGR